jgi:hypothetical protein
MKKEGERKKGKKNKKEEKLSLYHTSIIMQFSALISFWQ